MKRDMDLVRQILLSMESRTDTLTPAPLPFRDDYPAGVVSHHVRLLHEADFIDAVDYTGVGSPLNWYPRYIKPKGYDFLDDARNPTVWKAAKEKLASHGSAVSLAVFKTLLASCVKKQLGLD